MGSDLGAAADGRFSGADGAGVLMRVGAAGLAVAAATAFSPNLTTPARNTRCDGAHTEQETASGCAVETPASS